MTTGRINQIIRSPRSLWAARAQHGKGPAPASVADGSDRADPAFASPCGQTSRLATSTFGAAMGAMQPLADRRPSLSPDGRPARLSRSPLSGKARRLPTRQRPRKSSLCKKTFSSGGLSTPCGSPPPHGRREHLLITRPTCVPVSLSFLVRSRDCNPGVGEPHRLPDREPLSLRPAPNEPPRLRECNAETAATLGPQGTVGGRSWHAKTSADRPLM